MADSETIANFASITGANDTAARRMLELCGGDLEQAIQLWFADEELQRTLSNPANEAAPAATSRSAGASRSSSRPNRPNVGREDAAGVIHIDSDDDDIQMTEDDDLGQFDDSDDEATRAANIAQRAQEEEDAAMAKRLQEEMYGGGESGAGGPGGEDDVRAPMARTTETLVAPGGFGGDDEEMFEHFRLEQQRVRQARGKLLTSSKSLFHALLTLFQQGDLITRSHRLFGISLPIPSPAPLPAVWSPPLQDLPQRGLAVWQSFSVPRTS